MGLASFNRMRRVLVEAKKVEALKEEKPEKKAKEDIAVAEEAVPSVEGEVIEAIEVTPEVKEEKPTPRRRGSRK